VVIDPTTETATRAASSHLGEDVSWRTITKTARELKMPALRQRRSQVGATILRMGRAVNRWLAIVYATAVGKPAAPKKLPKVAMMIRRAYSPLPVTPSKRAAAGPESRSIPCENVLAARDPSDGLLRMAHRIFKARALASATPCLREFVQAPTSRGARAEPAHGFSHAR
jgi:hypothetical protein